MATLLSPPPLRSRAFGLVGLWLVGLSVSCGEGIPERTEPATVATRVARSPVVEAERQTLQALVDQLGADAPRLSPGTEVAIAVKDLTTGASASFEGETAHVAASAAKAIWVAAAVHTLGIEPVAESAGAIFQHSDPTATASLLARTGGRNVQGFYDFAGLGRSTFGLKGFEDAGTDAPAAEAVDENTTLTALDAVGFLAALDAGRLLNARETAAMRAWMRLSPRTGFGGWLGTRLPHEARAGLMHKAGWQPQGPNHILNDMGIVQVPHGHRYAVVLFARRGVNFWGAQIPYVENASAQIYRTVADLSGAVKAFVER